MKHVVTGGTGFVGAALVFELLDKTTSDIAVIVRPNSSRSPRERFREALVHALDAYAYDRRLLEQADARCEILTGDVTKPECAVAALDFEIDQFFHCAASLNYENRHRAEIEGTNVEGTRNALALAERLHTRTFNYVSTAYVAGKNVGLIREELHAEVNTNNIYEQSKREAENLVARTTSMNTRILRPSIVIGHSRTRAATAFSGFYGFVRGLIQFKGIVGRAQSGLLDRTRLRMRVDPDLGINLIPIDSVVRQAVCIALSDAQSGIFHLTHSSPPKVGDVIRTIFREVGLNEPEYVADREGMTWLDEQLNRRLDFYGSYIVGDKHFDRTRSDRVIGNGPGELACDDATISSYCRWYLEQLRAARSIPAFR
jgi:nucleoside-diphosphate-sugar epimerase